MSAVIPRAALRIAAARRLAGLAVLRCRRLSPSPSGSRPPRAQTAQGPPACIADPAHPWVAAATAGAIGRAMRWMHRRRRHEIERSRRQWHLGEPSKQSPGSIRFPALPNPGHPPLPADSAERRRDKPCCACLRPVSAHGACREHRCINFFSFSMVYLPSNQRVAEPSHHLSIAFTPLRSLLLTSAPRRVDRRVAGARTWLRSRFTGSGNRPRPSRHMKVQKWRRTPGTHG